MFSSPSPRSTTILFLSNSSSYIISFADSSLFNSPSNSAVISSATYSNFNSTNAATFSSYFLSPEILSFSVVSTFAYPFVSTRYAKYSVECWHSLQTSSRTQTSKFQTWNTLAYLSKMHGSISLPECIIQTSSCNEASYSPHPVSCVTQSHSRCTHQNHCTIHCSRCLGCWITIDLITRSVSLSSIDPFPRSYRSNIHTLM